MSKKAKSEIERARLAATVEAARCAKESLQQLPKTMEVMWAALMLNGFAPLPANPEKRKKLVAEAMRAWTEAQEARATVKASLEAVANQKLPPPRFLPAQPEDKKGVSIEAYVNKIAGSMRTGDNMKRVRMWLADRFPEADVGEKFEELRQEAAKSFRGWGVTNGCAEDFKKWEKERLSERNRAKGKLAAAKRGREQGREKSFDRKKTGKIEGG